MKSVMLGVCLGVWLVSAPGLGRAEDAPASGGNEPADVGPSLSGKVLETMDAGRYTYIRLQHEGKDVWAAGPQTEVAVGDNVQTGVGLPMGSFESPTLHRKFDVVYFVPDIQVEGKPAAPAAETAAMPQDATHQAARHTLPAGHPDIAGAQAGAETEAPPGADLLTGTVVQTLDASSYTYIEVKTDKGNRWLAAPQIALKAGASIRFPEGMEMKSFESPSLKRTFDAIYFVSAVYPVGE